MMTYLDLLLKIAASICALVRVNAVVYLETANISIIPKQDKEDDPVLYIKNNRINRITRDSFITYSNLSKTHPY